jgi:hypothetical protein
VYIITVYRSPLGDFNMFIETMHKLLGKIDYKNKNLIIGGDFNMHFNTNNKYAQSFSDLLQSYGLYSHVKFPTRGLSAIDNVFSNIITEDIGPDFKLTCDGRTCCHGNVASEKYDAYW